MTNAHRLCGAAGIVCGAVLAAAPARAQVVLDGNMDALAVGNLPDNATPNGAWAWPANYVAAVVAEPVARPEIYTVVATSSFQAAALGNSLHLINPTGTAADNYHLPNIWSQSFSAAPGLVLRVTFNLWVVTGSGGGSVYIGGDNGGGGFSNATGDRTAQISWTADGQVNVANNVGVNVPLHAYSFDAWQNIQVDIDTNARTYNLYWSMGNDPLIQIGTNLMFRAPNPALSVIYDRITYVQFGATIPAINSYLDNIVVTPLAACYPNCDASTTPPILNVADFSCFLNSFAAGDSYANCDASTTPPVLNIADFSCFLNSFAAGCG